MNSLTTSMTDLKTEPMTSSMADYMTGQNCDASYSFHSLVVQSIKKERNKEKVIFEKSGRKWLE